MLNGSAFNRFGFNAAAVAAVLLATASWSAEATVTAAATRNARGTATISCSANAIFSGSHEKYAWANWSAAGVFVGGANTIRAGSSAWSAGSTLLSYVLRYIPAEAGFDATATFYALPDAKLGEGSWTVGATFAGAPIKDNRLVGGWTVDGELEVAEALVNRQVVANWAPQSSFWVEPTLTSGGITYHEAYAFPVGSAALDIPNHLVATFVNGGFISSGAASSFTGYAILAVAGDWTPTSSLSVTGARGVAGTVTESASAAMVGAASKVNPGVCVMSAGATMTALPSQRHQAHAAITATGDMVADVRGRVAASGVWSVDSTWQLAEPTTWKVLAGGGNWTLGASLSLPPAEFQRATASWTDSDSIFFGYAGVEYPASADMLADADLSAFPGLLYQATAGWDGGAASLAAAGVYKVYDAPDERTFTVAAQSRTFTVAYDNRVFEVTA